MVIRVIKIIISLIVLNVDYLRKLIAWINGKKACGTCVVLYYHVVTPAQRKKFAQQMDNLIRWTKPISVINKSQLESGIHHVGVTFDDGFACIIENALPELVKRKIPFTLFVPTGCFGQQPQWANNNKGKNSREVVMTVDQLKRLKGNGLISVGSHCVTHSNLVLLSEEEVINEIIQSKHDLENLIQRNVSTMSFPYGAFNQALVGYAQEAGYKSVFTISPVLAFSNPDEYVTGRVRVDPTDWRLEFRLKLLGTYRWLPLVFALKAQMRSMLNNYLRYIRPIIGSKRSMNISNEETLKCSKQ
jgi:peptidoglycan/xylan/chitin deacetylase (PgdA/CDA1 family)